MAATMSLAQPCLATKAFTVQRPRSARGPASRMVVRCSAQQQPRPVQRQAALAAGVAALSMAVVPVAMAAQEALVLAEGEPEIVSLGWAALCVSFSASLAFVVWGRSGL